MHDTVRVFAPGRVNLIGDHTDYTGGLALPMAIDLGITIEGVRAGGVVELTSDREPEPAVVALDVADPGLVTPAWARFVAGVVAELRPSVGMRGTLTSTLPGGAGLSSSAALEVAVALALGARLDDLALAKLCRRAEQRGSGVPCGLMDQLTSVAGVDGAALLVDFTDNRWSAVPLRGVAVHVVHCGVERSLASSGYASRRAQCEIAARELGPLRDADLDAVATLRDEVVRRRARHVVSENARVLAAADALARGDVVTAGVLLVESHRSLRDDFEVSIPALDALVDALCATPGVHGARLTGAGFGGCAVALAEPNADLSAFGGWRVEPSAGAVRRGQA